MARPYSGAAGTHMFFGLLSIGAGIAWICLLNFYEPLFVTKNLGLTSVSVLSVLSPWVAVVLSAKIICGFWFFLTGTVGCCIKSKGCSEGVFVALNVLNVIIWAPVLLLLMVALGYIILVSPALLTDVDVDFTSLGDHFADRLWLWVFPGIGVLVGVVEFILSIVSYSIVCCCRPSSLQDGYEYQYEMK